MNENKAQKYMGIAQAVAKLSKDPSTKVGAIIIGPSNEIRSLWLQHKSPREST